MTTKARRDGPIFLFLGSMVFLLLGIALANTWPVAMVDFRGLYYPARCLAQHCDPYNEDEVGRIVLAEGGARPSDDYKASLVLKRYVYPPTAFFLTAPFALLPFGPASVLWLALTAASFVFASCLIWSLGADYSPTLSGLLIGFLLANSEVVIILGNMAGIAVSLCVVAVWCFLRERFILLGVLCLAASLCLKPQDAGLVWAYFLLAGGAFTKRALQTLFASVALSLPGVLWVWHLSPHWLREWQHNILAYSVRGGMADPGPASSGSHGLGMVVSLQSAISLFWDDPHIYNPVAYLVIAPLLLVCAFCTLRYRRSPGNTWLALAAIAALTMLPVYHRQDDTALLLLAIPPCAMLWTERSWTGRLALLITGAALVLTADIPCAIFFSLINTMHAPAPGLAGQILIAVQILPVPLTLLIVGIFYLWVYVRRSSTQLPPQPN
jgi:hypothetical protein